EMMADLVRDEAIAAEAVVRCRIVRDVESAGPASLTAVQAYDAAGGVAASGARAEYVPDVVVVIVEDSVGEGLVFHAHRRRNAIRYVSRILRRQLSRLGD